MIPNLVYGISGRRCRFRFAAPRLRSPIHGIRVGATFHALPAAVRVRAARRVVTCFLIGILLGASIGFLLGAAINALKS